MSFTSQSLLAQYLKKQNNLKNISISRVYIEKEKVIVKYLSYFDNQSYSHHWQTHFTTIDELINALILGVEPEKEDLYYKYDCFDE